MGGDDDGTTNAFPHPAAVIIFPIYFSHFLAELRGYEWRRRRWSLSPSVVQGDVKYVLSPAFAQHEPQQDREERKKESDFGIFSLRRRRQIGSVCVRAATKDDGGKI